MAASTLSVGHTDAVLCLEALPGCKLLASGGEDGAVCLTDLATLQPVGRIAQAAGDAVPSLTAHPAEEQCLLAAAGGCVLELDLRRGLDASALRATLHVSGEELNGLAASAANGGWLAAGDDAGEVQLVRLAAQRGAQGAGAAAPPDVAAAAPAGAPVRPASYRTLRRGHTNIVSAVAFRPHRPWELLSGGLDSCVVKWDTNRLRPLHRWSLAGEAAASGGQLFNPPMVHALAVPQCDDRSLSRLVAVGRGDGAVALYDADRDPAADAGASGGSGRRTGGRRGGAGRAPAARGHAAQGRPAAAEGGVPGRLALLGRDQGGHHAAVNSVAFLQGCGWRQLLSAGNDRRLLAWNWRAAAEAGRDAAEAAAERGEAGGGGAALRHGGEALQAAGGEQQQLAGGGAAALPPLAAEHRHTRKINAVLSLDLPGCPHNVFLADTGRRLTGLRLG